MSGPPPVWCVVGASSGFGHEIARNALGRGHKVVATARQTNRIQDLGDAGAQLVALDVTATLEAIKSAAEDVYAAHGRVDYLVMAAGYIVEGAVEELTPEEVYDCFDTNVFGLMKTIRVFLPRLRAQPLGSNGIRATIVTFGSLGSWQGGATFAAYAMTKSCASSLAESLREELSPFQIKSTAIEPGYFRTSFLNPGRMVKGEQRITAYDDPSTPSGKARRALEATDGKQPGDVIKGCHVAVDMLTGTGIGASRELPPRLVLGSDSERTIRNKCSSTIQLLDEWKQVSHSTDY